LIELSFWVELAGLADAVVRAGGGGGEERYLGQY
jgi:hypothetical protein